PSSAEDSPSGLWRSLGKRVGLTPSGVRIPYPPLNAGPALLRCRAWALSVSRDEPHGLDELQRQLRRTAPQVIERAAVPPGRKVLHVLYLLLSACALIGPIAAFTASLDMSEAPTRSYDFDPEFEIKVARIGVAFGIFFQGRMLYRWWPEGQHRASAAIV